VFFSGVMDGSARARTRIIGTQSIVANYPHVLVLVFRLQSVFPFIPTNRDYSGSAVILKE
jgi:hypothetical protein